MLGRRARCIPEDRYSSDVIDVEVQNKRIMDNWRQEAKNAQCRRSFSRQSRW